MKRSRMSKMTACLLAATLSFVSTALPVTAYANETSNVSQIRKAIEDTGLYLIKAIGAPIHSMVGGDWTVLGLARSEMKTPEGFVDTFYNNAEAVLKEKKGELSRNKYSEYSRLILALTATGKDPADVAGYNLIEKLSDLQLVEKQGINGSIYALLALDSNRYILPKSSTASVQTTRELLIDSILKRELAGGGFSLSGTIPDPDVTAAALQALSTYAGMEDVKTAIDRSLSFLSAVQTDAGGFSGWSADSMENTESIVQVILALTSLGIDPTKDNRFIKTDSKGKKSSPIDALKAFRLPDGSYKHVLSGGPDLMATEQALLALVSYQRYLADKSSIFDMDDSPVSDVSKGAGYEYKILLDGRYLTFDQLPVNRSGRILVPMRAIFEALGANVDWDKDNRKVTGTAKKSKIQLVIGDSTAYINDKPVPLDVPALIENGRTLVPVRFISESLDAEVDWDGNKKTVVIITE